MGGRVSIVNEQNVGLLYLTLDFGTSVRRGIPAIAKYDAVYQERIGAFCVSDNSALVPKGGKKPAKG
jgi:hypothetical protein